MILKRFKAENFRNIECCDISFDSGVNLLYGNNAQGKTNAVEGIYIFSRGKSFRGRDDKELIRFSEEGFHLGIEYESLGEKERLEYSLFGNERLRKKNGYKIGKIKEMIGSFRSVLFSPDDLLLVKESPERRREFINVAISQYNNAYISVYSCYKKALENRNHVLKTAQKGIFFDKYELDSWSEYMAEQAAVIYLERKNFIRKLDGYAKLIMKDISSGKEELSLEYKSDIIEENSEKNELKERYKEIFTSEYGREIAAGTTLFGPHRDDMEILINTKSARNFASQGQQRSIVLSLKLSEGEINREIFGEYPVFLFDDVLSELDEERRRYILSGKGEKQIIISSCEGESANESADRIIKVTSGEYTVIK